METWNCVYMIHAAYMTVCIFTTTEPWKCGTVYTGSMLYTYAIFNVYSIHIMYIGYMEPCNYGYMVHIYFTSTMVPRIWF